MSSTALVEPKLRETLRNSTAGDGGSLTGG
jgi:hypothetical protein